MRPDRPPGRPRRSGPRKTGDRPDSPPKQVSTRTLQAPARIRHDPGRELRAWRSAVEHLHDLGLPAAVDCEFTDRWLRKRGVRPDWTAR